MLTRLGEGYGAERMVSIQSAHACFTYPHLLASVELMERFARLGGKCRVPTTTDPCFQPCNLNRWKEFPDPDELQSRVRRGVSALESLGVIPSYSCTPYFQGNLPRCGEATSWMESSAIIFANSVLGARTNRTTMGIDVAAALAGKVPEFGLLLDENRIGNVLVRMEFQPKSNFDYGACGYLLGKHCSGKIPVIEGMPLHTTTNHLKSFGGAAASQGGIALYHAVGITPEARTREQAFKGRKPDYEITFGLKEIAFATGQIGELSTCDGNNLDAVLLGCPHPRVEELGELAVCIRGRKVKKGMKFCVFASSDVVQWSRRMGYIEAIEAAGVDIFENDCIVQHSTKQWGWKRIATNSAKYAVILPSDPTWIDVWYADTRDCVLASTV
jgi:predicted aconitase